MFESLSTIEQLIAKSAAIVEEVQTKHIKIVIIYSAFMFLSDNNIETMKFVRAVRAHTTVIFFNDLVYYIRPKSILYPSPKRFILEPTCRMVENVFTNPTETQRIQ